MKITLLIPAMVWALLSVSQIQAQHRGMPISSKSLLLPVGLHPTPHSVTSLIINKKHRHQGKVTAYKMNGDTLFLGDLKRGKLHGTWVSWYTPEQLCDSGRLSHNIPDGEWRSWYSNGQPRSVRNYSAFMLHRIKDEIPRRGTKATFFAITDIARTDPSYAWQLLTPVYSYVTLAVNAANPHVVAPRTLEARAEQNTLSGYHPYLPPFTECLHHGLYMNYYEDGKVKDSGFYHNGLRDGVWIESFNNGDIRSTGAYHHGHKQDSWKYYTASGRLIGIKMYNRRGKEIGSKRFSSTSDALPVAAQ
jgi:antitoxin component YwqK of YwqJK toxin-antitoxin module